MLPDERKKIYVEKGISEVNAKKIVQNRSLSDYLNTLLNEETDFKIASNMLLGDISAYLNKNEKQITDTTLTKERFLELIKAYKDNIITSKNLKDMLDTVLETDKTVEEIIKEQGIENISDDEELRKIIKNIITSNPESVNDYKNGHDRAIKYLMGQVMKETKGKANPQMLNKMFIDELNK
jgi:aspartyl-tRNA(Asn)/glutamyl-tRNA(Gln) amidotransferase subunit B